MEVLNMVLSIWVTAHIAMTVCSPVYPVLAYDVGQEEQNTNIFKKVSFSGGVGCISVI